MRGPAEQQNIHDDTEAKQSPKRKRPSISLASLSSTLSTVPVHPWSQESPNTHINNCQLLQNYCVAMSYVGQRAVFTRAPMKSSCAQGKAQEKGRIAPASPSIDIPGYAIR
jgi:hypothetical protein